MLKKGDLFFLNEGGVLLFRHIDGENGIVMSGPYLLFEKDFESETRVLQYYGYDVLIKGRLFKEIPEKFLSRVIKDEKDVE
jgi:hypothetical protein|tara:strand:+ start:32 stop:274 length:243 start_codon:yes stop_codon:yes gene_type:complete